MLPGWKIPTRRDLEPRLLTGAALFGIGWGLVGLCPGPALENLATLSPKVFAVCAAMAVGMVAYDFWQRQHRSLTLWLTDYVFNPTYKHLLSSGWTRHQKAWAANIALMLTMDVSG